MALTDYVIMPGTDYQALVDKIKEKTGKTDPLVSGQLAAELDNISGGHSKDACYVTFMSYDGSIVHGRLPVAVGYDCPNPKFTPTRESTEQYDYIHAGWATTVNGAMDSNALKAVNEDRTVYANFASVLRSYTITYYDGDTVLKTESLAYGATPSYTPTKSGYRFDKWEPNVVAVTGNASYTASWKEKASFDSMEWSEIVSIAESGNARDYFNIGDQRTVTYGGNDLILQIIGFDHDELYDGTGNAGMTIWTKTIPEQKNINLGAGTSGGYGSTIVRNYLEDTCKGKLPEEIAASIKRVKKYYGDGKTSGAKVTNVGAYLWLLSAIEIGHPTYAHLDAEGTQYEFFDGTNTPRTKETDWWTRSVVKASTSAGTFAYVNTSGNLQAIAATNTKGLAFGFCI